jgi:hypothetical protein
MVPPRASFCPGDRDDCSTGGLSRRISILFHPILNQAPGFSPFRSPSRNLCPAGPNLISDFCAIGRAPLSEREIDSSLFMLARWKHRGGSISFFVSNQKWLAHSFSLHLFCSFLFFLGQFSLVLLFPSFWPLGPGSSPPARPTTSPQSSQDAVENQPAGIPSWERSSEQFPLFPFQQKETGFDLLCSSATSFSSFNPHTTAIMLFARNKKTADNWLALTNHYR